MNHTHAHTYISIYSNQKIKWKQGSYTIDFQQIFTLPKFWKSWDFVFKGMHQTFKRKRSSIKPMVLYGKERQNSNYLINVGEDLQKCVVEELWISLENEVNIITTKCTRKLRLSHFKLNSKKSEKKNLLELN